MDSLIQNDISLFIKIFALSVGHTEQCVEETIATVVLQIEQVCSLINIPIEKFFMIIGQNIIEQRICDLLDQKDCDCLKQLG